MDARRGRAAVRRRRERPLDGRRDRPVPAGHDGEHPGVQVGLTSVELIPEGIKY